jgi:hypothetical protein
VEPKNEQSERGRWGCHSSVAVCSWTPTAAAAGVGGNGFNTFRPIFKWEGIILFYFKYFLMFFVPTFWLLLLLFLSSMNIWTQFGLNAGWSEGGKSATMLCRSNGKNIGGGLF